MSAPSPAVTREELVARARELGPVLAERATKTEELRRLPEESFQAFKDASEEAFLARKLS